jgi:phospholipase C
VECDYGKGTGIVMGYYDGNTVTAWWNYAQHYALSDNFSGTMFGPSSVGAINLVAGTTSGLTMEAYPSGTVVSTTGTVANGATTGVLIGDVDPWYDDCSSSTRGKITNGGQNIGDLLNKAGVTWGCFQGGFAPTNGLTQPAVCGSVTSASASVALPSAAGNVTDYVPHHEPFQYYPSTSNPHHLLPTGPIGTTDQANHQYDLSVFTWALSHGELPAVTFIKPKKFQNAHPGNSDPLDEQTYLTTAINAVMNSKYWDDTAIIVTYDDSDGWYDHQMDSIVNQSSASDDALATSGSCGTTPVNGNPGRCGYGPRFPMIVISPYAKANYIDHRAADQSSITRFIEDNWLPEGTFIGGDSSDVKAGSLFGFFDFDQNHDRNGKLILKTTTGEIVPDQDHHHDHDHGDW